MASQTHVSGSSALADVRTRRPGLRQFSDRWSRSMGGQKLRRPPRRRLHFSDPAEALDIWTLNGQEVRSFLEESWR
ncbi:MAG: hypothetical protein ACNA8R_14275 [Nitriliruptoraceae bacterium]